MKRIIAIVILAIVMLMSYFFSSNDLYENLSIANISFNIQSAGVNTSQLVEIDIEDLDKLLDVLNVNILSDNIVSGSRIIEGYSNKLNQSINVNSMKTNIQISISDKGVLIGYPLIYNSF